MPAFNGGNRVARRLSWIGVYAYPIYVMQFVAFRAIEAAWKARGGTTMPTGITVVTKYVGAIVFGVMVARTIERPMIRLRNRLFPNRVAPA